MKYKQENDYYRSLNDEEIGQLVYQGCSSADWSQIKVAKSYIANYRIGDGVVIHNITTLAVDGESTFGNGVTVEAINESGGREVPIYDHLSTHVAYMVALYRHRPSLILALIGLDVRRN